MQILKAKVFYFLDDIESDMGCFSIVPASHTWPEDPPGSVNSFTDDAEGTPRKPMYDDERLEGMPGMKKITAPAGTLVMI